jgi:hypothetical protein
VFSGIKYISKIVRLFQAFCKKLKAERARKFFPSSTLMIFNISGQGQAAAQNFLRNSLKYKHREKER